MKAHHPIAVFDLGKTNSKLFVIDGDGNVVAERRTKPVWREHAGLRVLDDDALFAWMTRELEQAVEAHGVRHVTFSGHGCTFALIGNNTLFHPILDYEQEPPQAVAARIDALIPSFSETFSPRLPLGFNYGRHVLWLADRDPRTLEATDAILAYPQFWSWKFSGKAVSEVSYLGCHSHLWAPIADDFSSLVDGQGWRSKMPEFAAAGALLGTHRVALGNGDAVDVSVHNGVHDSNSALFYYRSLGFDDFTLISTGTWVIIFNQACPLDALDRDRDMLANVTVDHAPAATIRFMGGREYDVASDGWTKSISVAAIEAVITKGSFALPSFAAAGPFPDAEGRFAGPSVSGEERAAVALLYVTLMTDLSLDLIRSENEIVIDGGLVKTDQYAPMLAALRNQTVFTSANPEGSAFGAAALVFRQAGLRPFKNVSEKIRPAEIKGLEDYRREWRRRVEEIHSRSPNTILVKEMRE
ncbi:carbohydrate kinase [Rhizobium sp. P32RR-XVIII]|uniref:FGGY-family carbohydrate kinase n=1 Tax=Rhizobium sp. P32RR-XVIII TaxID=2726738 RepID=UPI00145660CE|nr:carbohydrate kinase [Rhizobium sp. P32RR-XVIII]NLS07148.1 carbohydrate kinase [Rhizobium sp. P32RR-XVIII]